MNTTDKEKVERIIPNLAHVDMYKLTMLQFIWFLFSWITTTFRYHNRTNVRIADIVDIHDLRAEFEHVTQVGFPEHVIEYLRRSCNGLFREKFLAWLPTLRLNMPTIGVKDGQFTIEITGSWAEVTLWETITLKIVNELYFRAKMKELGLTEEQVFAEGRRRLFEKIKILKQYPDIVFTDFGDRRHFSLKWHREVIRIILLEIPNQLAGVSNVALACEFGVKPSGTIAHEMDMVFSGIFFNEDSRTGRMVSHETFMRMWENFYCGKLSIALTDTYGSSYFFDHFKEFAKTWDGVRHDSGDPFEFGENVIGWYKRQNNEPKTKTLVFSDGLILIKIIQLWEKFHGRIKLGFGWGTHLTNDMGFDDLQDGNRGLKPISIVMKAVAVIIDGFLYELTKLSDNPDKATGSVEAVDRVKRLTDYDACQHERTECEV